MSTTAKKPKKIKHRKPSCECLKAANDEARKRGFVFSSRPSFNFDKSTVAIEGPFLLVERTTSKKRLPMCTCAFCPFCGKKKRR